MVRQIVASIPMQFYHSREKMYIPSLLFLVGQRSYSGIIAQKEGETGDEATVQVDEA